MMVITNDHDDAQNWQCRGTARASSNAVLVQGTTFGWQLCVSLSLSLSVSMLSGWLCICRPSDMLLLCIRAVLCCAMLCCAALRCVALTILYYVIQSWSREDACANREEVCTYPGYSIAYPIEPLGKCSHHAHAHTRPTHISTSNAPRHIGATVVGPRLGGQCAWSPNQRYIQTCKKGSAVRHSSRT